MRLSVRRMVVLPQPDGPDERRHLALAHVERDVAHGRDAVVAHGQAAHLEHRSAGRVASCSDCTDSVRRGTSLTRGSIAASAIRAAGAQKATEW